MSVVGRFLRSRWTVRQSAIAALIVAVGLDLLAQQGIPGLSGLAGAPLVPGAWFAHHIERFWHGDAGTAGFEYFDWGLQLVVNTAAWTVFFFAASRFDRSEPETDFEG